jgi:DNA-directed RNA polymerase specialized sigma24 family protein
MPSAKRVSKHKLPSSTSRRTKQRKRLKDLIDSNRARENELNPYERGILQGYHEFGAGYREISDELKIPESTVQRILEETPVDQGGIVRLS